MRDVVTIVKKQSIIRPIILGGAVTVLSAGVLASATFAVSSTANTTVNATIASTISISSSGTVNLAITPTASGSATSASDTVSVSTNDSSGYTLQLADADTNTNLVNGANNIPASSGTFASPATLADNTWGYRVDGAGNFGSGTTTAQSNAASLNGTWAGVPSSSSPATLKATATTASGSTTTVWYGAMANTSMPNGTYTDTVTYTATGN